MNAKTIKDSIEKMEGFRDYIKGSIFDQYNIKLSTDMVGRQIIEIGVEIGEAIEAVCTLLPKYEYALSISTARYQEAIGKAYAIINSECPSAKEKEKAEKRMFCKIKLDGDDKETTPHDEYINQTTLEYICSCGKNRLNSLNKKSDFVRSVLSYNKLEITGKI